MAKPLSSYTSTMRPGIARHMAPPSLPETEGRGDGVQLGAPHDDARHTMGVDSAGDDTPHRGGTIDSVRGRSARTCAQDEIDSRRDLRGAVHRLLPGTL